MQTVLAASTPSVFDSVIEIFSSFDALAHPDILVHHLETMSAVWAVIFLAAGLTCLFQGYRIYKTVTVVLALSIGAFTGYYLGKQIDAAYIVAGCMALLLAVGCFPLMKYAVAALGGLAGGFTGANLWSASAHLLTKTKNVDAIADNYWIGALVGVILGGMLAFILFRFTIVVLTSVSGSTIAVLGAIALLLQVGPFHASVSTSLSAHAMVLPLLVFVPAVIGLILQQTSLDAPVSHGRQGEAH